MNKFCMKNKKTNKNLYYHLRRLQFLILTVFCCLDSNNKIAKAIADSDAAIVRTNKEKTCPFISCESRKVEKVNKLRLTALNKISKHINTRIKLLLVSIPYKPIKNIKTLVQSNKFMMFFVVEQEPLFQLMQQVIVLKLIQKAIKNH